MLPTLVAIVAFHHYGATPQAAARTAIYSSAPGRVVVRRTNMVGRFATVLMSGAWMEGAEIHAPILVERFPFGWQPLELLNFRCSLLAHKLGARVDHLLMRGMPAPHDDAPCTYTERDAGPVADIDAIRKVMRGALIPAVVVVDDWAVGSWYGAGGGESIYHKRDRRWALIASGGGAFGPDEARKFGIPTRDLCPLNLGGAGCR